MENNQNKNKKGVYILLSIFIASAIWFFVDEYGNNGGPYLQEKTVEDIPIEYRYENILLDRDLMVLEEGTTATIDLTLEGGRRLLSRLDRSDIQVTVDLSAIAAPGIQNLSYKISFSNNRFNNLTRKTTSPGYATVNISELNKKTVDIRCELVGNVADGYSAGALQLEQTTVDIRGLDADIEAISYAKVTLDIGKDAMETVSRELTCQFYDRNDNLVDIAKIHPSADAVLVTLPIYVTKDLTLEIDLLESAGLRADNMNISIEPAAITVTGDAIELRNVERITIGELDLLTVPKNGISTHSFSVSIPETWQNVNNVTRATITVSFKDMVFAKIPVKEITYINQPEGKEIYPITQELMISVYGKRADVETIVPERLSVTADFRDFSGASGIYTVPVTAEIASGKDVGISGKYEIKVDIQELDPGFSLEPDLPAE
ncbi:MAG: hypothetical protein E7429_02995 [Ruminococcaceae bacterium]|nr:hypothetical protein [Oscillospiraceae bacterium]